MPHKFVMAQYPDIILTLSLTDCNFIGGGMAEWLASPDCDREAQKVAGSNPGVARSDEQWQTL